MKLNENKLWYKTIEELLQYIKSISNKTFIIVDTETTGLKSATEEQLLQISSIAAKYDFENNTFNIDDLFNKKIKLSLETKSRKDLDKILKFVDYGEKDMKTDYEYDTVDNYFDWITETVGGDVIFLSQNAKFDMRMLYGRGMPKETDIKVPVIDMLQISELFYLPLIQKLSDVNINKYQQILNIVGFSSRYPELPSSSLNKLGSALNINLKGQHDALTDCYILMELFTKEMSLLKQYDTIDISKYQIKRIKVNLQ